MKAFIRKVSLHAHLNSVLSRSVLPDMSLVLTIYISSDIFRALLINEISGLYTLVTSLLFLERIKMFSVLTVDKSCISNKESIALAA